MKPFLWSPRSYRDLRALTPDVRNRIINGISALELRGLPGPPQVKKLKGRDKTFRLRVDNYRAVFSEHPDHFRVLRVVDRKDLPRIVRDL